MNSQPVRAHRLGATVLPLVVAVAGIWTLLLVLGAPAASARAPRAVSARAQSVPVQQTTTLCDMVTAVPPRECKALLALYGSTGGPDWIDNSNWLSTTASLTPCDWYGVVCDAGHVTQLQLRNNGLKGALPATIQHVDRLTHLDLAGNVLRGAVPNTVCALTDTVRMADVGYNALYNTNRETRACLDQMDPDWLSTQTLAPRNLQVTEFFSNALQLNWMPIPYIEDGGYYEISYSDTVTGAVTVHGQTTDKSADGYLLDGLEPGQTYYIRVRTVTPAHAANANKVTSDAATTIAATESPGSRVLVISYFPADNDLSPNIPHVVDRFRRGTALNPTVHVVLLVDGAGNDDTRIVLISNGNVTSTDRVSNTWGVNELDTGDPEILAWFLSTTRERFPADRTVVTLLGHGVALTPDVAWVPDTPVDQPPVAPQPGIPPLPRGHDFTPGDVTDGGYMSTLGLGRALAAATDNGANPFDLIFFDQCFQGNLDILYEVHWAAEVFIASPNYAWLVAAYEKYLTQFTPTAEPAQMANAIIHLYQRSLNDFHPNAIFWMRGADIPPLAAAVSNLGAALTNAVRRGEGERIGAAAENGKYVDTTQCGRQNLTLGPPDELIGVGQFAQNLRRAFPTADPAGVQTAAADVLSALDRVESTHRIGTPYLAPDEVWDYDDSITVLAPLAREAPADVAWRASIYRDAAGIPAQWSISPTQTVVITTEFAFVRDGVWDEFLAEWYTLPMTPTVGEWCHYIPPAMVVTDTTEAIALTVRGIDETAEDEADASAVQLDWTESNDDTATEYGVFVQGPFDIDWVLLATVPLTERSFTHEALEAGETYRYMVLARGAGDAFVAQSNEAEWDVPAAVPQRRVYMPIVRR